MKIQRPPSTHPAHPRPHCWSTPTQHVPMSPLLISRQQAHTHVSIAVQHPTNMSPLLCGTYYKYKNISISKENAFASLKLPRVVGVWELPGDSLTNVTWPSACPLFSSYHGARTQPETWWWWTIWPCQAPTPTPREAIGRSGSAQPPHPDENTEKEDMRTLPRKKLKKYIWPFLICSF